MASHKGRLTDDLSLDWAVKTARKRELRQECQTVDISGFEYAFHQQMSVFIDGKARLVFENCPIRVIFSQRQGMNVFREDAAFQHFNKHHLDIIASLPRFQYVLDIQDEGIFWLIHRPPASEIGRFGTT